MVVDDDVEDGVRLQKLSVIFNRRGQVDAHVVT
jgi:hypothetical protein